MVLQVWFWFRFSQVLCGHFSTLKPVPHSWVSVQTCSRVHFLISSRGTGSEPSSGLWPFHGNHGYGGMLRCFFSLWSQNLIVKSVEGWKSPESQWALNIQSMMVWRSAHWLLPSACGTTARNGIPLPRLQRFHKHSYHDIFSVAPSERSKCQADTTGNSQASRRLPQNQCDVGSFSCVLLPDCSLILKILF